jgi:hypothetical protein
MGIMLRRVPGQARWRIFKDGGLIGDVFQNPDGTWESHAEGDILTGGVPAGTRRDAARQLTGQDIRTVG